MLYLSSVIGGTILNAFETLSIYLFSATKTTTDNSHKQE